jgi:hypothetical protein
MLIRDKSFHTKILCIGESEDKHESQAGKFPSQKGDVDIKYFIFQTLAWFSTVLPGRNYC